MALVCEPPIALYNLGDGVNQELSRIVATNGSGKLRGKELNKRVYALDTLRFEPPCTFIMRNFERHRRAQDEWLSESFYTHPQGYKMNLSVYANGNGDGYNTDVSVFVQIMWGEFDSVLQWPYRGQVTVELLDQSGNRWPQNRSYTTSFARTTLDVAGRVRDGQEMNTGLGWPTFIPQRQLTGRGQNSPMYLKDDCISFRVTNATQ